MPPVQQLRLYRLTDRQGQPHPVLDECFESVELALEAAMAWLEQQGLVEARADQRERERQLALQVGLEMSTPSGSWRTLRHAGFMARQAPGR
ncbi:MAG: hypothetical protein FJ056_05230 [Cyanobacteria bacterium M_surface_10_m2_179]|nr:hypothetical protein [Cyanobacteria bacterium M_surface_10_m2_179]